MTKIDSLRPEIRAQINANDDDYSIVRKNSRMTSVILSNETADLIREFASPTTIIAAIISYSRPRHLDPERTLIEAFPVISKLVNSGLLVSVANREMALPHSFEAGFSVANWEIQAPVQILEDCEVYLVRDENGCFGAMKIAGRDERRYSPDQWRHEISMLHRLKGLPSVELLDHGEFEGRPFFVTEWFRGSDVSLVAAELRKTTEGFQQLLELCCEIADRYAVLHNAGIVHGDVHPRNILCDSNLSTRIIDFALSVDLHSGATPTPARGGIAFFFEPEYVATLIAGETGRQADPIGEQYSVAALMVYLITGAHYLPFSVEPETMWLQILKDSPVLDTDYNLKNNRALQDVLLRALSKNPQDRHSDIREFSESMRKCIRERPRGCEASASQTVPLHLQDLLKELVQAAEISGPWFSSGLRSSPTSSLVYGSAGIGYMLYRLACIRDDCALLSAADVWSTRAIRDKELTDAFRYPLLDITPDIIGEISPYHTLSGLYAVRALISYAMNDPGESSNAIQNFIDIAGAPCENLDLALGRSGVLLACSLLLESAVPNTDLIKFGDDLQAGILEKLGGATPFSIDTEVTDLGIAHGWAGIAYAILKWNRGRELRPPKEVSIWLDELASYAEPIGRGIRFPVSSRKKPGMPKTYMSGWCHGSAGHVFLWSLAHEMFSGSQFLGLGRGVAWNCWETPTQLGNLCCGLAGQTYALLHFYRRTGDESWLRRASRMAGYWHTGAQSKECPSHSLFKGDLGMGLLAAELSRPESARMPFFE